MKFPTLNLRNYFLNTYKKNTITDQSLDSQKHKIALELSGVGLWDWNIVTNKVSYSNESKQIIGYKKEELENTSEFWDKKYIQKTKTFITVILKHF